MKQTDMESSTCNGHSKLSLILWEAGRVWKTNSETLNLSAVFLEQLLTNAKHSEESYALTTASTHPTASTARAMMDLYFSLTPSHVWEQVTLFDDFVLRSAQGHVWKQLQRALTALYSTLMPSHVLEGK